MYTGCQAWSFQYLLIVSNMFGRGVKNSRSVYSGFRLRFFGSPAISRLSGPSRPPDNFPPLFSIRSDPISRAFPNSRQFPPCQSIKIRPNNNGIPQGILLGSLLFPHSVPSAPSGHIRITTLPSAVYQP